jgi:hypothetical protein
MRYASKKSYNTSVHALYVLAQKNLQYARILDEKNATRR